jgi:ankyrin repeat protein
VPPVRCLHRYNRMSVDFINRFAELITNDEVIRKRDEMGFTVLHACVENASVAQLEQLISRFRSLGMNVDDAENQSRRTPLHEAVRGGKLVAVVTLVEEGDAQPKLRDASGLDCAHLAAQSNQTLLLFYFLQCGVPRASLDYEGKTPLHWAAEKDAAWSISLLIAEGSDINSLDSNKSTPLHLAAVNGHEEAVRLLVEAGAALDHRDKTSEFSRSRWCSQR